MTTPPARLGRYQIRGVLGQGGFAVVYRAYDPRLEREVALKSLLPYLAEDVAVRLRFLNEARATARLHHEHIVTLHDVGEADGQPFYTMELIDGVTLEKYVSPGEALALDTVHRVMLGICQAVDYLHGQGLIHRDIKPANVMIERGGRVMLMDFGIARTLDGTRLTITGTSLGTPEYMSPEQVRGTPVDRGADIYALGVLTYRLLSGRPPFSGDTAHLLYAHAWEAPPPLRSVRPGLPERVYTAVEAALAKDPAQRPPTALDLARALEPPSTDAVFVPLRQPTRQLDRTVLAPPSSLSPSASPTTTQVTPVDRFPLAALPTQVTPPVPPARRSRRAVVGALAALGLAAAGVPIALAFKPGKRQPSVTPGTANVGNGGAAVSPTPTRAAAAFPTTLLPADAAPSDQQHVSIRLAFEPEFLDPHKSQAAQDITVERLLWRGLFTFDGNNTPVPALALEVPTRENGGISADGLTYTIRLKPGQKFSDGNPLTAGDVEYSIKRMLDPATRSNYASFYYDIAGAEAFNTALGTKGAPKTATDTQLQALRDAVGVHTIDQATVQFRLTQPGSSFVTRLALWAAYPVEAAAVDRAAGAAMDAPNLVGNGPFVLTSHQPGDRLVLEANPSYTAGPRPRLSGITLRIIGDQPTALAAYRQGEVDYVDVSAEQWREVTGDATLNRDAKVGLAQRTYALEFNLAVKPLDNPLVRRAFALALDRDVLVRDAFNGAVKPGATWLPPGLSGYSKDNESILQFDVQAARKALQDAGFPNGQSFPATLTALLPFNNLTSALMDSVQKQLQTNLNVTLQPEWVSADSWFSRYDAKQFQVTFAEWIGDYPNADDWLPHLFESTGTQNKFNYSNARFDAAVQQAVAEPDPVRQAGLWSAAERLLLQDAALAPLQHAQVLGVWNNRIRGMQSSLLDTSVYGDTAIELLYVAK